MGRLGGLGVLNLDGVQTRYENPKPLFKKIAEATPEEATRLVQEIYKEPFKEKLVAQRVKEIKAGGALCAVSSIPQNAEKVGKIAADAGADLFVVQGTVTTARFKSSKGPVMDLAKFCERMKIPVIIGNVVTYSAALELMETGVSALLVGVGPGAACTSRGCWGWVFPR
jgi:IMP dehydrogenase